MHKMISIPVKSFSVNAMFCRNGFIKTQKYNEWTAAVFHRLDNEETLQAFSDLRTYFDPKQHIYQVDLRFFYPKEILYTKSGSMSAKAHDLSNVEKPLIDLIFLPQYFNKSSPYGCKNLNIDDKFIRKLTSEKLVSDEHKIEIDIRILPI